MTPPEWNSAAVIVPDNLLVHVVPNRKDYSPDDKLDPTTCILYVPKGAKNAYANDNAWGAFTNIVEIDGGGDSGFDAALDELEAYVAYLAAMITALEKQYPTNTELIELTKKYKVQLGTIQNTIYDMRYGFENATQEAIDKLKADAEAIHEAVVNIETGIKKEYAAVTLLREKHAQLIEKLKEAVASLPPLDATAQAAAQVEVDKITTEINMVADYIDKVEATIYIDLPGSWFEQEQAEIEAEMATIEAEIEDFVLVHTGMADVYAWLQKVKYVCQHYKVSDASTVSAILTQTEQTFATCRNAEVAATALSEAIDKLNAYLPEVWLLDLSLGNNLESIYANYASYKTNEKYIIAVGRQEKAVSFRSFINLHADYKDVDLSSTELPGGFTFKGCLYVENVILPENGNELTVGLLDNCPLLTTITSTYLVTVTDETFAGVDKEKVMLYVPHGMKGAYQVTVGWREFTQIYETGQNVVINKPGDQFDWGDGRYELSEDNYIKLVHFDGSRVIIPKVIVINNVFYTVRYIGTGTFVDSNVTEIVLPDTPGLVIEKGAFVRCYQLTYITIVKNVTIIMPGAFEDCRNLKNVHIESEDLLGGEYNFDDMFGEQVEYVYIDFYIKRLTGRIFRNTHVKHVYLFDDIEEIDDEVFSGCRWLVSITLPKSLRFIGKWAFLDCENLAEIIIPEGVREFGEDPFKGCVNLVKVIINNIYIVQEMQLGGNGSLGDLFGYQVRHIEIGGGVEVIRKYLFRYLVNLEYVYLPDGVETIEEYAFENCTKLTYVRIPHTVYVIRIHAFEGCTGFTDVLCNEDKTILVYCNPQLRLNTYRIPDGITRICDGAFWGCDALKAITLPASVATVGENVFYGCTNIIVIYVYNIVPPTATSASFTTVPVTVVKLKVPAGAVDAYRLAAGWKDFINIEEITDNDDPDNSNAISATAADNTNGKAYNLSGAEANDGYRGIVIKNGKKVLRK